ncbi:NAD(P)/FAD-dependent oxidoreductase [Streptomyces fragilis]|uniref:FAD-dependent oxidoreductase n=1 Tax=Streptomyces fragilis TaxID=67301 RepID=A0ABV2YBP4_9ACTN|nr:FAD-dependent oxidoreductase [Streptomyces fragilis]
MNDQRRDGAGRRVVVAGAGMAGVRTAEALREQGFTGPVTLIGAEPHPPYDRPPLSKGVLLGGAEGDGSAVFDVDFAGLDIDLRLGCEVTGVRVADKEIDTDQGPVGYDVLVAATGAHPVRLPGTAGAEGVHVLHNLDDALRLRPVLERNDSVVVVGAGWIGAEFTTAARAAGCEVTVVEATGRPLSGALPAEIARPMARWYAESGATLLTDARVERVEPGAVLLADGRRLEADAVVVGIGARPATAWLADAVELGPQGEVLADARLRASAPDVYAVGDCASFPSARYGERLLIHHWDNALQGARTVAEGILDETPAAPYDPVPYFWSEQFGRFVQYAGHHAAADTTLWRGAPEDPAWSVCWLREGRLVALLAVGRPRDLTQGRKLIESGALVDPDLVRDPDRPLKAAARR